MGGEHPEPLREEAVVKVSALSEDIRVTLVADADS
jgi:hypothetical protein